MSTETTEPTALGADPAYDYGNRTREIAGWIVLTWEHDRWNDDWDGLVHRSREAAEEALAAAGRAGYEACLTVALIEMENGR